MESGCNCWSNVTSALSYCIALGDISLSCTLELPTLYTVCVFIEQKKKKNPSGRIILETANFVLSEFFGIKNRLLITSLLVIVR